MADYNSTFTGAEVDAAITDQRASKTGTLLLSQDLSVTALDATGVVIDNADQYTRIKVFGDAITKTTTIQGQFRDKATSTFRTANYSRSFTNATSDNYENGTRTNVFIDGTANTLIAFDMDFTNMASSVLPTMMSGWYGGGSAHMSENGWYTTAEVHDQIKILTGGGTATNGTLIVVGYP